MPLSLFLRVWPRWSYCNLKIENWSESHAHTKALEQIPQPPEAQHEFCQRQKAQRERRSKDYATKQAKAFCSDFILGIVLSEFTSWAIFKVQRTAKGAEQQPPPKCWPGSQLGPQMRRTSNWWGCLMKSCTTPHRVNQLC